MAKVEIGIDDALLERAAALYGPSTPEELVDLALRLLTRGGLSKGEALALEGAGWPGELTDMRDDAETVAGPTRVVQGADGLPLVVTGDGEEQRDEK